MPKAKRDTRKKPTALKLLQGTARPERTNKKEPKGKKLKTTAPKHMYKQEKKYWKDFLKYIDELGVGMQSDRIAIELLVSAYADYREAREIVWGDGEYRDDDRFSDSSVGRNGEQRKLKVEYSVMRDAYQRLLSLLREFGMTPNARAKVETLDPTKAIDPLDEFF